MFSLSKIPLFLFLLFSFNLAAQDVDIDWGPENDDGDKKAINFPIGWHDEYYYNLRMDYKVMSNKYEAFLEKVDKRMKVVSVKQLPYESEYAINFDYMIAANEKFYLFSSTFEKTKGSVDIYYTSFDLNGRLLKKESLGMIKVEKRNNHGSVKYSLSADRTKLAALHSYGGYKDEDLVYHTITIPVDDISSAKQSRGRLKSVGYSVSIGEQQINNEGLITAIVVRQKDKKLDPETSLMVINGDQTEDVVMEYNDFVLDNFSILEDENGEMKLTGFYLDKVSKKKSFYKGFFISTFHPANKSIDHFTSIPFTKELIEKFPYLVRKRGASTKNGRYHTAVYPSENGGGYIVAENIDIYESGSSMIHAFKELLVVGYNDKEQFTFIDLIPKLQLASYQKPRTGVGFGIVSVSVSWDVPFGLKRLMESYTTYSAINHNGKLYIMFNDNEDNAEIVRMEDVEKLDNPYKAATRLYVVDTEGNLDKEQLIDNKKTGGYFSNCKAFTTEEPYVIGVKKRKSQRFGILTFDEQ